MLKVIARMLRSIADKIDDGSISSNPEETMQVMEVVEAQGEKMRNICLRKLSKKAVNMAIERP